MKELLFLTVADMTASDVAFAHTFTNTEVDKWLESAAATHCSTFVCILREGRRRSSNTQSVAPLQRYANRRNSF